MLDYVDYDGQFKMRAAAINGSWWLTAKDLLGIMGCNAHNTGRTVECIPSSLKKKVRIKKSSMVMLHEKGCWALLATYGVKNESLVKFLNEVFSRPIVTEEKKAPTTKKAAKPDKTLIVAPQVVPAPATSAVSLDALHDVLEENQSLINSIVQKLQSIQKLRNESKTAVEEEFSAAVDDLNPAANDKIYYMPAKRKDWRLWVNRVVDKLAVKYEGDQRTTASILWDKLYKHVEEEFDIDLRQIMRELNAAANYKGRIKSRVALVNKNDTWMLSMVKYAYDMAINAEVPLPKDFELVKITVPAAQRRSA